MNLFVVNYIEFYSLLTFFLYVYIGHILIFPIVDYKNDFVCRPGEYNFLLKSECFYYEIIRKTKRIIGNCVFNQIPL